MSESAESNGIPVPRKEPSLEEVKNQRALVEARLELAKLRQRERLLENIDLLSGGWGGIVDPRELIPDAGSNARISWIDQPSDRRMGRDWPIWQTEQDLGLLRQASYNLCRVNAHAKGLLKNLTNYGIGTGYRYNAGPAKSLPDADPDTPGAQQNAFTQALVDQTQAVVDEFTQPRLWDPHPKAWWLREREAFRRTRRDGEAFIWVIDTGKDQTPEVRFIEPAQVLNPPGKTWADGWSYGIRHRINPDGSHDVETPEEYYAADPDNPAEGIYIKAEEVIHVKNPDDDAGVKRGIPDFTHDTYDALKRASVLQRNMSIGSAIQAAIAEIEQWATATKSQMEEYNLGNADVSLTNPLTGRAELMEESRPGQKLKIPKGKQYVPPPYSQGIPAHVQVCQNDLRMATASQTAPHYFTGDVETNYAGLREASAPFIKCAESEQEYYKHHFLRVIWRVVKIAVTHGRLPAAVFALVTIQAEAPVIVHRDPLQQTQRNETLHRNRVKSVQTWQLEEGLDPDTEAANFAETDEQDARRQALLGPATATAGGTGPDGQDPLALDSDSPQAFPESVMEALLESGFTGTLKDKKGREYHYEDGKRIAHPDNASGKDLDRADKKAERGGRAKYIFERGAEIGEKHGKNMAGLLGKLRSGEFDQEDAVHAVEMYHRDATIAEQKNFAQRYAAFKQKIIATYGESPLTSPEWKAVRDAFRKNRDAAISELDAMSDAVRYAAADAQRGRLSPGGFKSYKEGLDHAQEQHWQVHNIAGTNRLADAIDAFKTKHQPIGTETSQVKESKGVGSVTESLTPAQPPPQPPQLQPQPQPVINVTVAPPAVTVNLPEQQVTVNVPEQPPQPAPVVNVDVAAPSVTVEPPAVTVQAPQVTVQAPALPAMEMPTPVVNVTVAAPQSPTTREITIKKSSDGTWTGTAEEK